MNKPAIEGGEKVRTEFLPFAKPLISDDEIADVVETLKCGWLTVGPKCELFEKKFSEFTGAKYAISTNSCTSALHLSLVAMGIKDNDEVITTPLTFCATTNVIELQRANTVFVDIKEDTFEMDADLISEKINNKTKAILPVHYAGLPCEMDKIMKTAKENNLRVIEDAAHSINARYNDRMIGSIGDTTCFSFYATKNITTGEGGMVTTNDDEIAKKIFPLRLHGMSKDAWKRYNKGANWGYDVEEVGYKYNMTDVNASLGIKQLEKIDEITKKRRALCKAYEKGFSEIDEIRVQREKENCYHARYTFPIVVDTDKLKIDRDKFIQALYSENIGTSVHFIPVYRFKYYANKYGYKPEDFPNTEKVFKGLISLPLSLHMNEKDVEDVVTAVKKIVDYYRK